MFNQNFSSFCSIFRSNYRAFTRQVCAFLACSPFQKYCCLKSSILKLFSYLWPHKQFQQMQNVLRSRTAKINLGRDNFFPRCLSSLLKNQHQTKQIRRRKLLHHVRQSDIRIYNSFRVLVQFQASSLIDLSLVSE